MGKIKEFFKKHKGKILFVTCVVGSFIVGVLIERNGKKGWAPVDGENVVNMRNKNWVSWPNNQGAKFISLDDVKTILDLNAGTSAPFAIIKEGFGPDEYTGVLLSDDVITQKKEETQDGGEEAV